MSLEGIKSSIWSTLINKEKELLSELDEIREVKFLLSSTKSRSQYKRIATQTAPALAKSRNIGVAPVIKDTLLHWPTPTISCKELQEAVLSKAPAFTQKQVLNQIQHIRNQGLLSFTKKRGTWSINQKRVGEVLQRDYNNGRGLNSPANQPAS